MNPLPIIQVNHLFARYNTLSVLDDISFSVQTGEIFVIVGGSGSGKTTLLNHMIGLLEPVSGEIWIDGNNISESSEAARIPILRKIGVMFQQGALFGSMTLLENICLPLEELTSLSPEAIHLIAQDKLKTVGLVGFENYLPSELSGGMQKRAAIARAMALDPAILFLDEPSAGLDPLSAANLDQLIVRLSKILHITFVVVSHELASIYTIAERVIMLQQGKIIAEGRPEFLRDHSDIPYVRQFFNRNPSDSTPNMVNR